MRTCTKCNNEKTLDEFYDHPGGTQGKQSWCKICVKENTASHRKRHPERHQAYLLKRRYGITQEEVDRMSQEQNGLCAICHTREWRSVDHCHSTGQVRGLLCNGCNGALGFFEKYAENMRVYLDRI